MLNVVTWCWGKKYGPEYVERLHAGVKRHLKQEHRFLVCRPAGIDIPLLSGCLVRMRMFDPAWQWTNGINPGDRIVSMDLDNVITGPLDPLFDRPEDFVILQGVNAVNPCPYNGSMWMLRAGYRPDVWSDLTLDAAAAVQSFTVADDQSWMAARMPNAGAWGPADGVYGYMKPGWCSGRRALPGGARVVAFFGYADPSKVAHLGWVREHWRT